MNIGETMRAAAKAVTANKMRSGLTMLGVIIGIAAVIAMVGLGEGAQKSISERLQSLGTNVVSVRPGSGFARGIDRGNARLTVDDAEALAGSDVIAAVVPEMESRYQVEYGGSNGNLSVLGTWPDYFGVRNQKLADGRFFTMAENDSRRRVAVIGALVGERLGVPTASLLGQKITIRGVSFEVIGILAKSGSAGFQNPDEGIYIPLATAQYRVAGSDQVRTISLQAGSASEIPAAMAEADRILRREHRIPAGGAVDYTIGDQAALLETMQETARTFTFLLAGIAFISLVVGGIGIMNIMLVSVTERTKEIGLRKALGAKKRDVLLQFLIEALVLCLSGGGMGLLLGIGATALMQRLAGWQTAVAPEAVVLAFGFSALVGIFFGLWPARRAARLAPIEALRFE